MACHENQHMIHADSVLATLGVKLKTIHSSEIQRTKPTFAQVIVVNY